MEQLISLRKRKIGEIITFVPVLNAGLLTYDLGNRCLIESIGYFEMKTGYSFEELSTPGFYMEIIHPDDRKSFELFHKTAQKIDNEKVINRTYRFRKKNNTYGWFHFKAMPFERFSENKHVQLLLLSSVDVTDKMKIINKLEEKNAQLDTISHINAHEVRAPVASILGLTQLLSDQSFHSEADKEIFMHFKKNVEQLDRIIQKISRETEK